MGFRARITLLTTVLVIAVTGLTLLSVLQLTKSVIRREMGNQLLTLVTRTPGPSNGLPCWVALSWSSVAMPMNGCLNC